MRHKIKRRHLTMSFYVYIIMEGMNIMMQKMSFGKYQGKSVAYVVLKDFEYFIWMYQNNMSNRPEYTEALRLLQILDAKPFYQKCYSCRQKAAVKFSLYHGGVASPSFFCEECDPYSQGAIRGKLAIYSSLLSSPVPRRFCL